jgi:hypothetical protein
MEPTGSFCVQMVMTGVLPYNDVVILKTAAAE